MGPYALECRLLGGIAAYELGDWAQADEILAGNGDEDAPDGQGAAGRRAALRGRRAR